jgi:hypothetical protein
VLYKLLGIRAIVFINDSGGGSKHGIAAESAEHQGKGKYRQEQTESEVAFVLQKQLDFIEGDK